MKSDFLHMLIDQKKLNLIFMGVQNVFLKRMHPVPIRLLSNKKNTLPLYNHFLKKMNHVFYDTSINANEKYHHMKKMIDEINIKKMGIAFSNELRNIFKNH